MNQSESIAALAAALSKAQGVMEGASKDSSNPFFKSKYADLASVWDACRRPLADNGLSVVQTSCFIPEHPDLVCIETILCHSSGEWIKGILAVKPVKSDPQSVGSCITYLRRYSLQSIVGIAPEDDDGNAASGKEEEDKKKQQKTPPKVDLPATPSTQGETPPQANVGSNTVISEAQGKRMFAISNATKIPIPDFKRFLMHYYGFESSKDVTKDKYDDICETISSKEKFDVMMKDVPDNF